MAADLTLIIELAMGVALIAGAVLARRQHYRAHACCQSVVVLLNLAMIATFMAPAFRSQVAPRIPARLGRSYYALATAHAALGIVAELLGLFIVLAAGIDFTLGDRLPPRFRFTRYKAWMRTELALWWTVLVVGIATYARWYVMPILGH
ncbi:MAG TPA: DUF420 domain-containing protein [Terriglobia bacterium]|nr:DUF420 domain-containing protein [Terriglobia bacterium]